MKTRIAPFLIGIVAMLLMGAGMTVMWTNISNVPTNLSTFAALDDPNADRIVFWDDSAKQTKYLTLGANLSITDTTINAESSNGTGVTPGDKGDITVAISPSESWTIDNGAVTAAKLASTLDLSGKTVSVPTISGTSDNDTSAASTAFVQAVAALKLGATAQAADVNPSGTAIAAALAGKLSTTGTAADVNPAGSSIAAALSGKLSTAGTAADVNVSGTAIAAALAGKAALADNDEQTASEALSATDGRTQGVPTAANRYAATISADQTLSNTITENLGKPWLFLDPSGGDGRHTITLPASGSFKTVVHNGSSGILDIGSVTLYKNGESCTCIWNGSSWLYFGPQDKHMAIAFDPKAVCDGAVDRLFVKTVGSDTPGGLLVLKWKLSFEADPTTEIDLDLKRADAWIGVSNAAVMDVLDTTNGASSESTPANINSGAAVADGKVIYLEFGTAYTEANHQCIFELWYR